MTYLVNMENKLHNIDMVEHESVDNVDEVAKIYYRGIEEGKKHAQPSPETILLIKKIHDRIDSLQKNQEVLIESAVSKTVNGKIDKLLATVQTTADEHRKDMEDVRPIVIAYQTSQRALDDAKAGGRVILWVSGFITAVGGAYLIIMNIFFPPRHLG